MKKDIIDFDALWISGMKCKNGVMWKPATKHFNLNAVTEIHKMYDQLQNRTWKNGRPRKIQILYPKKREGLSISLRDRIYQRSINDNELYPNVQRSFILDNCACQQGKGPDFARKRIKKHLWNHYSHFGTNGYVLQIDVTGYYPNMRHDKVKAKFKRYLDEEVYQMVCDVLDSQYKGEVGYNPGSQMVQIAGISLLDDCDHYCKEKLHLKHYMRYMDDIWILHESLEYLEYVLEELRRIMSDLGFELHERKTRIIPLTKGFTFLGFEYRITKTGKIIMTLNSPNIKHERKKLVRMVHKAKKGLITREKADECFRDWCENARKGNSHELIRRMTAFYEELWEEILYENSEIEDDSGRAGSD